MIRAKYIMCRKSQVSKKTTGQNVVYKLMATGCPGLPVVNEGSEIVGVVTMCDILRAAHENGGKMKDITAEKAMSKVSLTAGPDTPLEDISKMMVENNHGMIPIVKGKKLLGIVSGRDIVGTYVEPHLYSVFDK